MVSRSAPSLLPAPSLFAVFANPVVAGSRLALRSFSGVGGPAIDQIPQLPFAWWASLGFGITFCEFYRISIAFRELDGRSLKAETAIKPGYEPGQIGFDPLSLAPEDPAEFKLMQEKELAHARLGMIAAAGFLAQEAVTKSTWGTIYGLPDF